MARHLSTNSLIDSVRRRAMLPSNSATFKDADFLAFANEEMDMAITPYVMSFHEDYFLVTEDVPLEDSKSNYAIPYRAAGNKLRDLQFKDNGGNLYEMTRISKGDAPYYQFGAMGSVSTRLKAFYLENNEAILVPDISGMFQGSLSFSYYRRANTLVAEDRIMTIQAIDFITGQITVDAIPEHVNATILLDIIQVKSPHKCLIIDVPILAIDSTNNIISIDPLNVPEELVVGDQIAQAEECIIPQIPTELHSMLAQRVACRCLEALGDQQGLAAAMAKLAEMELKGGTLIDSRVDDAPFKVLNRHSFLRTSRRYVRR